MDGPVSLRTAAIAGAAAWAAYALLESFLLVIANRLLGTSAGLPGIHAGFTALLLVAEPLLGVVLGVAIAATVTLLSARRRPLRAGPARTLFETLGALPLVLAVGAGQLAVPSVVWRNYLPVVGAASVLTVLHLLRITVPWCAERLRFLTFPIAVAGLLLVPAWVADRIGDRPVLAAAAAGATAVAVAALAHAAARRRPAGAPRRGRRGVGVALLYVLAAALVVAAAAWPPRLRRLAPQRLEAAAAIAATERPNLVLVTLDTVRADHLSLYGYERETTPRLARLAASATVYERATAAAPMTLDSHGTLFTGLYPARHGAHYGPPRCPSPCPLDEAHETVAERLSRIGYRTAGVVANHGYLGSAFGLDQGFEIYDQRAPAIPLGEVDAHTLRNALVTLLTPWLPVELSERVYFTAGEITDRALAILDELVRDERPFLLFVNYMDAHEPYRPPAPYDRRYPGKDERFRRRDFIALENEILQLKRPITDRERAHIVSQYDGAIAYMDVEVDRVIDRLRRLDLYDDTAIVVTSDHGEAFGERQLVDHQVSAYQDQVHVPLLVKLPGQRAARRVRETVSLADLFPTLLELASAAPPSGIDGVSLLADPLPADRLILSESYSNHFLETLHPRFRRILRAGIRGSHKLHVSTTGAREAYDLTDDPGELHPLDAAGEPFAAIDADLAAWLALFPAATTTAPAELDAETQRRLKALGYL